MSTDDQFHELTSDIEFITPTSELRGRAQHLYEELRAANPWLPDADRVVASEDITVTFGPNAPSTINLSLYIDLPDEVDQ